jgi:YfiH family protein
VENVVSELFRFRLLASFPNLIHGISDRTYGSVFPDEAGGRQRFAEALGVAVNALVPTRQVHQNEVATVSGPQYDGQDEPRGADALITVVPGWCLLGFFADCVPILAFDPVRRAVGLAHAGWRGSILRITERLVEEMDRRVGTRSVDLYVGVGPSIGPCCYEVGEEVLSKVEERLPDRQGLLRPARPGHAYLDLWEANRRALLRAGVLPERIEVAGLCTACHVERFFSFRREGALRGLFGAAIGLRDEQERC